MAAQHSTPYGVIYRITNAINGKIYIGQTTGPLYDRWSAHCKPDSYCSALRNSIQKYGKDNFKIVEIDRASSKAELDDKENFYIKKYDSMNSEKGYNLRGGGSFGKHSEESKKLMSKSVRKAYENPEFRKKLSAVRIGKRRSEEFCKKTAQRMTGTTVTQETRNKIANTVYEHWKSEEYRQKVSDGQKATRSTDAYRQMVSNNTKAQLSDPDKKAKLMASQRLGKLAMWADPVKKAAIIAKRNATNAAKRLEKTHITV